MNFILGKAILQERKANKDNLTQRKTKRIFSLADLPRISSISKDMIKEGIMRYHKEERTIERAEIWMWRKLDHSYLAGMNIKWYSHTGKQIISHKTKHAINI